MRCLKKQVVILSHALGIALALSGPVAAGTIYLPDIIKLFQIYSEWRGALSGTPMPLIHLVPAACSPSSYTHHLARAHKASDPADRVVLLVWGAAAVGFEQVMFNQRRFDEVRHWMDRTGEA